jgi:RNA polymerase sigma-70 factor (ECF subfamily)
MSTDVLVDFRPQHPQPSDDQLLSEARSGDGRAFDELCQRYSGMLKQRIFRIVRHREDAEDVLQETLLSAYLHLDSFRGACRFSTWVIKIGSNTALMFLRKRKSFSNIISGAITHDGQRLERPEIRDPSPNPEQRYMTFQTYQRVKHVIRRLPPRISCIVDLYYRQECRLKDAAKALGITEPAAKSTVLRARKLLRRSLDRNSLFGAWGRVPRSLPEATRQGLTQY